MADRLALISRLLRVVSLLQTKRRQTLASLAEFCECSPKTVQRDIERWSEMGVIIVYDRGQRSYVLRGDPPIRILNLGVAEATALALAEASTSLAAGLPLEQAVHSAFEKIHCVTPPELSQRLDEVKNSLLVPGHAKRDYSHAPLPELLDACRLRWTVRIDYSSLSSNRRVRTVEPFCVALLDGFWMLIALDADNGEVRDFALDRVHGCSFILPPRPFHLPPDWTLAGHMIGSVGVLHGKLEEVELRFSPAVAPWLQGRQWPFPYSLSEPDAGGCVTLTGTVAGLDEICREVLRWGRHVEALAPEALRQRVAVEAAAIAALYAPPNIPPQE